MLELTAEQQKFIASLPPIEQQIAALTQPTPKVEHAAESEPVPESDALTEEEAISIVQSWVTQDAEVELSERRPFEEMVETLQDAGEYRGSDVTVSRLKEIVNTYAPNAPKRAEQNSPRSETYPPELKSLISFRGRGIRG